MSLLDWIALTCPVWFYALPWLVTARDDGSLAGCCLLERRTAATPM